MRSTCHAVTLPQRRHALLPPPKEFLLFAAPLMIAILMLFRYALMSSACAPCLIIYAFFRALLLMRRRRRPLYDMPSPYILLIMRCMLPCCYATLRCAAALMLMLLILPLMLRFIVARLPRAAHAVIIDATLSQPHDYFFSYAALFTFDAFSGRRRCRTPLLMRRYRHAIFFFAPMIFYAFFARIVMRAPPCCLIFAAVLSLLLPLLTRLLPRHACAI